MDMFIAILGLAGAGLCVLAYGLLGLGRIDPKGLLYFVLNGLGGLFLLISIAYDYDSGDTGGLAVEACWVLISVIGIVNYWKRNKNA